MKFTATRFNAKHSAEQIDLVDRRALAEQRAVALALIGLGIVSFLIAYDGYVEAGGTWPW